MLLNLAACSAVNNSGDTGAGETTTPSAADTAGRYRDNIFIPRGIEAAKLAMENRAPATVQTATVVTEA